MRSNANNILKGYIERVFRMNKFTIRKILALIITTAYILINMYFSLTSGEVGESFSSIMGIIIGYYFGKANNSNN